MKKFVSSTDCNKLPRKDDIVVPLLTGRYHLLTPPSVKCKSVEISIHGSNKVVKKCLISTSGQTANPVIFDGYGNMASISTT